MKIRKIIIGIIFCLIVGLGTTAILMMLSSNNEDAGTFKTPTPSITPLRNDPSSTPLVFVATRPIETNCVFPMIVWVKYPASWPIEVFEIGGVLYDQTQMIKILQTNTRDIPMSLMKELIITALDDRFGADTGDIAITYNDAVQWFLDHAGNEDIPGKELQDATRLMQILQDYNTGLSGPGLCEYSLQSWLETRTPFPTEVAILGAGTLAPTRTPIVFGAQLPTPTPKNTDTYIYFTPTYSPSPQPYIPKPKPKPTRVPPTQPPPTAPPPPPPTDVPLPPTLVPTTGSEPTAVPTPG